MQELSVIFSGFDPYPGVDINPALIVPDTLAAEGISAHPHDFDDPLHDVHINIHAVHMPVSFTKAWPTLRSAIDELQPQIVIASGLKRPARGILLERCATNRKDITRPDVDNVIPSKRVIDPEGPAAYWTGLPLRAILRAFAADNIPATLSSDAGTYVCNALFYALQEWAAAQSQRTLCGFVNLPLVNDQPNPQHGLPLTQQITAARDVVREAARYYLRPVSADILLP